MANQYLRSFSAQSSPHFDFTVSPLEQFARRLIQVFQVCDASKTSVIFPSFSSVQPKFNSDKTFASSIESCCIRHLFGTAFEVGYIARNRRSCKPFSKRLAVHS